MALHRFYARAAPLRIPVGTAPRYNENLVKTLDLVTTSVRLPTPIRAVIVALLALLVQTYLWSPSVPPR
jgi:hypothetical protein